MALRERLEGTVARGLAALPAATQVRLSGKAPITLDGDTLLPEVQLTLALLARRRQDAPETLSPQAARAERRRMAAVYAGPPVPVRSVQEKTIDATPPVRARHYAPPEAGGPHPLMIYFHGGGFTYGDLDTHDGICRMLCRHAGTHVLAIDYRLAPEHRFPAAVDDAYAALAWARENAAALGADPGRLAVGGDSAGGNLAAVLAQHAREDGGRDLALQLLIYPVTDFSVKRPSHETFAEGFLLTQSEMDWFEANYLGEDPASKLDPRASPLLAEDLSGLAPAVVATAAFDPLRDEGEDYARALQAAGTPVIMRRFPGFIHAFVSAAGVSRACRDAVIEIAGAARAVLAVAHAGERTSA